MPAPLTLTCLAAAAILLFVSGWLSGVFCLFALVNEIALAWAAAQLIETTPEVEDE